jgi:hypothetical protein
MSYSPLAQTLSVTQTSTNPITLAGGGGNGSSVTITHPAVTNNELALTVSKYVSGQSYTNTGINFSSASNYVQQNSASGTQINVTPNLNALSLFATLSAGTYYPTVSMTSNSAPSPYAAAGTFIQSGFNAYQTWCTTNLYTTSQMEFATYNTGTAAIDIGSAIVATGYLVGAYQQANNAPSAWTVSGSNIGLTGPWTTLDSRTGQNPTNASASGYTFSNSTPYRYYQIAFTNSVGGSAYHVELNQVQILGPGTYTYPTGTMYYATTSTGSSFSLAAFSPASITSVTFTSTTPSGTTLVGLVSFDGRTTWKYRNGSAWTTTTLSAIATNGTSLSTITTALAGVTVASLPAQTALDFAWGLETTSASATPAVFLVTIVIALPAAYQSASVGKLGVATQDIGMLRASSTTTVLVNNTPAALQIQAALQVP